MKIGYIHIFIAFIITIGFIMISLKVVESFGSTSPGTLVNLMANHVPTQEDLDYYMNVYPKMVRDEIKRMTES